MPSSAYESIENLIWDHTELSDSEKLVQLRSILQTYPDVVHEKDKDRENRLLLHSAAAHSSPRFCKLLIEGDNDLNFVKARDIDGELPFHYACRNKNFETVKYLFHLWPACINIPDNKSQYPIHNLLDDSEGEDVTKLCHFLLQHDQGAVSKPWAEGMLPLHVACYFHHLEAAKLLYNAFPQGINTQDNYSRYPIHHLLVDCRYIEGDITELCQFLLRHDRGAVTKADILGRLPLHLACEYCDDLEVMKLVYNAYSEGINTPDICSQFPIHNLLVKSEGQNVTELCKFLLQHDQGAVTTPDDEGRLPLHLACDQLDDLEVIKLVYNAYPEGINTEDVNGQVPLEEISSGETEDFFRNQLDYIREAQEVRIPDINGQLPLHRAVQNADVPEGTIKLMIAKNPVSALQADHQGLMPLHLACQAGNLGAIKYLANEHHAGSFQVRDGRGELPLHHACRHGKCDVIIYILKESTEGIKVTNTDGKLPIWSLFLDAPCDRDSIEYIGAVDLLLRACPDELVGSVR